MRDSQLQTGAKGIWSGTVSTGATWSESFELDVNGAQITGADTSTWKIVIKKYDAGTPSLTLTSGVEITVAQNTVNTIFTLNVPPSTLCNLSGDYRADLAQQDVSGNVTHWLSGTLTFIQENLGF